MLRRVVAAFFPLLPALPFPLAAVVVAADPPKPVYTAPSEAVETAIPEVLVAGIVVIVDVFTSWGS